MFESSEVGQNEQTLKKGTHTQNFLDGVALQFEGLKSVSQRKQQCAAPDHAKKKGTAPLLLLC